ncbi:hypothetical protein X975_13098, partial [Stegodyphus mimosarum]
MYWIILRPGMFSFGVQSCILRVACNMLVRKFNVICILCLQYVVIGKCSCFSAPVSEAVHL